MPRPRPRRSSWATCFKARLYIFEENKYSVAFADIYSPLSLSLCLIQRGFWRRVTGWTYPLRPCKAYWKAVSLWRNLATGRPIQIVYTRNRFMPGTKCSLLGYWFSRTALQNFITPFTTSRLSTSDIIGESSYDPLHRSSLLSSRGKHRLALWIATKSMESEWDLSSRNFLIRPCCTLTFNFRTASFESHWDERLVRVASLVRWTHRIFSRGKVNIRCATF